MKQRFLLLGVEEGKANALSIAPRQLMLHIHVTRILGTRGFFSRATGNFLSSATGRHVFRRRPKTRAAKHVKSLWHPGYVTR